MSGLSASLAVRLGAFVLDVVLPPVSGTLALIGPNGSGKSTLLRLLAGAIDADSGEVDVDGTVLFSSERGISVPIERRRVGYVPQGYGLFPHLSVIENVAFGLAVGEHKVPAAARALRARTALRELGCEALSPRAVGSLSGGEQQRVALARALVIEPGLLLLDEPLSALDAATRRSVRAFLGQRLSAFARPAVVVTHDVRDVAALADVVCVLEGGRVVQRGTLAELRSNPASEFVSEFLGLPSDS